MNSCRQTQRQVSGGALRSFGPPPCHVVADGVCVMCAMCVRCVRHARAQDKQVSKPSSFYGIEHTLTPAGTYTSFTFANLIRSERRCFDGFVRNENQSPVTLRWPYVLQDACKTRCLTLVYHQTLPPSPPRPCSNLPDTTGPMSPYTPTQLTDYPYRVHVTVIEMV